MGVLIALFAAVFLSGKDVVSKRLAGRIDGTVSTFASFAYALPFYVVVIVYSLVSGQDEVPLSATFWVLVIVRSITDCGAEWFRMTAFHYADLSLVACIFSLSPLFLLLLSPVITNDPQSPGGIIAVLVVVVGSIILVYRPAEQLSRRDLKGIVFALIAAVFFAVNSCFDRLAVQHGSPLMAGFTMTLFSMFCFVPSVIRDAQRKRALITERGPFALRGLFELLFMVAKLWALKFLQAPYVVAILRSAMIFSVLAGGLYLKERDFVRRLTAAFVILIGVIWIIISNMGAYEGR